MTGWYWFAGGNGINEYIVFAAQFQLVIPARVAGPPPDIFADTHLQHPCPYDGAIDHTNPPEEFERPRLWAERVSRRLHHREEVEFECHLKPTPWRSVKVGQRRHQNKPSKKPKSCRCSPFDRPGPA